MSIEEIVILENRMLAYQQLVERYEKTIRWLAFSVIILACTSLTLFLFVVRSVM